MIYGIFSGCYSDWSVHGYFDNKEESEKYCCVCNGNGKYDTYYVKPLENLKGEKDLSSISLKYEYCIAFEKIKDIKGVPQYFSREIDHQCYIEDELRYNKIEHFYFEEKFYINIDHDDYNLAQKIAQDYFAQLRSYGDGEILQENIDLMNDAFKAPYLEKKRLEEVAKLKEKELAELARLKEKYEGVGEQIHEA